MATECWFRNPDNYIRELVECGEYKIAWDRGLLVKKRIDPIKHAQLYFGQAFPWRLLLVGEQGTAEYVSGKDRPVGVYPTWEYGEDAALLEEVVSRPVGADPDICADTSVPIDERPVFMQDHRVVIINPPNATSGQGRRFMRYLKELQEDHPDCIIHVHGLYGFRIAFGMGFGAADIEPRTAAQKGKVHLPSGGEQKYERVQQNVQWVTALGFRPADLAVPRNRCMYNIKSAAWAAEHYQELFAFRTVKSRSVDTSTPDADFKPATSKSPFIGKVEPKEGDQFVCNTCSLQTSCKYFRDGAVCSVPGAEPTDIARMFGSRDSNMIIDGLGTLMQTQTRRLQRGMEDEEFDGELSPEVTKLINGLFDQGVKLAKLIDPNLRGGAKVNVNIGPGGQAAVSFGTPQQMIGAIMRELESRGIPRDKITPEMVQGLLESMADPAKARQAIEGKIIDVQAESA